MKNLQKKELGNALGWTAVMMAGLAVILLLALFVGRNQVIDETWTVDRYVCFQGARDHLAIGFLMLSSIVGVLLATQFVVKR